jgi:hypothetical protein
MKAEVQVNDAAFQPVTLTLTLESAAELQALYGVACIKNETLVRGAKAATGTAIETDATDTVTVAIVDALYEHACRA